MSLRRRHVTKFVPGSGPTYYGRGYFDCSDYKRDFTRTLSNQQHEPVTESEYQCPEKKKKTTKKTFPIYLCHGGILFPSKKNTISVTDSL